MNAIKDIALNGVLLAVIAHGLIGISLIWDKALLKRPSARNLLPYVFWLGAISIFGLVLIPFGFKMPSWKLAGMGFAAGLLDLIASYFYYSALKSGEASEELAVMGGFAPVATALIAIPLLREPVGGQLAGRYDYQERCYDGDLPAHQPARRFSILADHRHHPGGCFQQLAADIMALTRLQQPTPDRCRSVQVGRPPSQGDRP